MRLMSVAAFAVAFALGAHLSLHQDGPETAGSGAAIPSFSIGVSEASAGPAIRSARRTARRHVYYYSLPPGCVTRVVAGVRYRYCSGVYYQVVTDESGKTAYIIVNP